MIFQLNHFPEEFHSLLWFEVIAVADPEPFVWQNLFVFRLNLYIFRFLALKVIKKGVNMLMFIPGTWKTVAQLAVPGSLCHIDLSY